MLSLRSFLLFLCASLAPMYAQEGKLVVVDPISKELKRAAHRLRIPADQMKNARQVLQEATDLARKTDPVAFAQFDSLAGLWIRLNPSRAKAVGQSLLDELRSAAQKATDAQSYQRATTTAMSVLQQIYQRNSEKALDEMKSWPAPPASAGNLAQEYRANLERQIQTQAISQLAYSNPEKALEMLSQMGKDAPDYLRSQIAQGFMNSGKKDQAFGIVDARMSHYAQHASDPGAAQEYQQFAHMMMPFLDTQRAVTLVGQVISQPGPDSCKGTLKVGDKTVELSCSESRAMSLLGSPSKPQVTSKILESLPSLKSKLDSVGGTEVVMPDSGASTPVQFNSNVGGWMRGGRSQTDSTDLYQELRGKTESDHEFVKGKLRDMAKGPEDIDKLINLAQRVAYEDPDLGSMALEFAKPLLGLVEPAQKRSMSLQNLVRAYRQVEGEADVEVLRDGFILADRMRREQDQRNSTPVSGIVGIYGPRVVMPGGMSQADQLEAFLVSELARDNFESAIRFIRAMPDDALKLSCLIQATHALCEQNY